MASSSLNKPVLLAIFSLLLLVLPLGSWASLPNPVLQYHNGPILTGQVNVAVLWYGRFARETKNILRDFIRSLNSPVAGLDPSVASWWKTVERYQAAAHRGRAAPIRVKLVKQKTDKNYSVGKILTVDFFAALMDKVKVPGRNLVTVIFTAPDVSIVDTCTTGRCSKHGVIGTGPGARLYIVVGNPETECPGVCGWPFHKSNYGPQTLPLQPPNGNVGADAMVVGLASALAATVTNPYNNGFYMGPITNPVEAVNACPGMFGSGALPGFAGKVLIAPGTGGCFNAHGIKGRKFLLPALWNPDTKRCWTLL